ncbi:fatty acid amide hydrolase isoform X1 [Nematostella vectensis]|nr:fatty acid amide hydrolase isoform X1 [Nematostella vectensis]
MRILKWLPRTGLKSILAWSTMRKTNLTLLREIEIPDFPTVIPVPLPSWKPVPVEDRQVELEGLIKPSKARNGSFQYVTISDLISAFRSGKTTPLEVVQRILDAMREFDAMNPPLLAITQCHREEVLKLAKASTERYAQGKSLSIFDGIPVAFKEEYSVVSYRRREGTTFMGDKPCDRDAVVVKKLRDGGAVIIGMTNMHEIGIGVTGSNVNRLHGTPRNPHNVHHYTGGSSSGSAAAVAAGLCVVGLGTDGGGSIRIPSSACGVVGVKATFNRITKAGLTDLSLSGSVGHAGPICNSVRDAAITYAYLAGPDPQDTMSLNQPVVSLQDFEQTNMDGVTIAVDWRFFEDTDKEVFGCCQEALRYLESRGATVVSIQIPELEEARVAHIVTILTEFATGMEPFYKKHYYDMNPDTVMSLSLGRMLTAFDYYQAQKQRTRMMQFLEDFFQEQKIDCIITPALGIKVPKIPSGAISHGEANTPQMSAMMRFMQLGNLTGVPCMTLPVGYDGNGLPISLQVMSGWWQEHKMLRVAHACENVLEKKQPQVYRDMLQ